MGIQKQLTKLKKAVCKRQDNSRKSVAKYPAVWQAKAKKSYVDLLDDDIDTVAEGHMSLTSGSSTSLTPIPLESHDSSWKCEFNEKELEYIFH